MLRGAILGVFALSLSACGEENGGDDGLTGFGPGTTGATSDAPTSAAGSGTSGADSSPGVSTTAADGEGSTAADDGPASDDASTEPPAGSSDGPSESTGPPPGGGALGECLGTGAWQTCAQWCSANDSACVEGGCDGSTVVYYGDVDACTAMGQGQGDAQACDADFQMGGGISFARCCCG